MEFTCVLQQGIDGGGLGASRNGEYRRDKRGHDPFNTGIKNKSSLATFSKKFSKNKL